MVNGIDLDKLRQGIRTMTPRRQLFKVLKEELGARGYWRNHPRGDPQRGYARAKGVD